MNAQWFVQEEIIEWHKASSLSKEVNESKHGCERFLVNPGGAIEARLLRIAILPLSHHLVLDKDRCISHWRTTKDSITRIGSPPSQVRKALSSNTALLLFTPMDAGCMIDDWVLQDRKTKPVSRSYDGLTLTTMQVETYADAFEKRLEWRVYFSRHPVVESVPIYKELVINDCVYRRHYFVGRYTASREEREFMLSLRRFAAEKVSWEKAISGYAIIETGQPK